MLSKQLEKKKKIGGPQNSQTKYNDPQPTIKIAFKFIKGLVKLRYQWGFGLIKAMDYSKQVKLYPDYGQGFDETNMRFPILRLMFVLLHWRSNNNQGGFWGLRQSYLLYVLEIFLRLRWFYLVELFFMPYTARLLLHVFFSLSICLSLWAIKN